MQQHLRENYLQYPGTFSEQNMLNPCNFKELYPIFCIDATKQAYEITSKSVSCELHVDFKSPTTENLKVFIVWTSDRVLDLKTDGSDINIKTE